MSNVIYLEVRKADGAILSYFLDHPTTQSTTVDYVPATKDELTYLSALEENIFPAGTVATISDLSDHRKRVQEAKAIKSAQNIQATQKAAQKSSQNATDTSSTLDKARLFKAGLKPANKPRKQP